jgi:hypothetical protein
MVMFALGGSLATLFQNITVTPSRNSHSELHTTFLPGVHQSKLDLLSCVADDCAVLLMYAAGG